MACVMNPEPPTITLPSPSSRPPLLSSKDYDAIVEEWEAKGEDGPPPDFLCPISLEIMVDPVVVSSGQTYDRFSIERWFRAGHRSCPKTSEQLSTTRLVPHDAARRAISAWCSKHGMTCPSPRHQHMPMLMSPTTPTGHVKVQSPLMGRRLEELRGMMVKCPLWGSPTSASAGGANPPRWPPNRPAGGPASSPGVTSSSARSRREQPPAGFPHFPSNSAALGSSKVPLASLNGLHGHSKASPRSVGAGSPHPKALNAAVRQSPSPPSSAASSSPPSTSPTPRPRSASPSTPPTSTRSPSSCSPLGAVMLPDLALPPASNSRVGMNSGKVEARATLGASEDLAISIPTTKSSLIGTPFAELAVPRPPAAPSGSRPAPSVPAGIAWARHVAPSPSSRSGQMGEGIGAPSPHSRPLLSSSSSFSTLSSVPSPMIPSSPDHPLAFPPNAFTNLHPSLAAPSWLPAQAKVGSPTPGAATLLTSSSSALGGPPSLNTSRFSRSVQPPSPSPSPRNKATARRNPYSALLPSFSASPSAVEADPAVDGEVALLITLTDSLQAHLLQQHQQRGVMQGQQHLVEDGAREGEQQHQQQQQQQEGAAAQVIEHVTVTEGSIRSGESGEWSSLGVVEEEEGQLEDEIVTPAAAEVDATAVESSPTRVTLEQVPQSAEPAASVSAWPASPDSSRSVCWTSEHCKQMGVVAGNLRALSRASHSNRLRIAYLGGIQPLLRLLALYLEDREQSLPLFRLPTRKEENGAAAGETEGEASVRDPCMDAAAAENLCLTLLNMALEKHLKAVIGGQLGAIPMLVHFVCFGAVPSLQEAALGVLSSLSVADANRQPLARAGALSLFLRTVQDREGRLTRARKDAIVGLFNLAIDASLRLKAVEEGVVEVAMGIVEKLEAGIVDEAVALLANVAKAGPARTRICKFESKGSSGVACLVAVVEDGSPAAQANAAATLLALVKNEGEEVRREIFEEGVVPSLVVMSESGTQRGKEKAKQLLQLLRT